MDSLTQIVLGASVGELAAGKKLGRKAFLWGAIGGTIPDLDVFFSGIWSDQIEADLAHRGFSHSILFAILAAPLLAWLLDLMTNRKHGFRPWFLLFFFSIFTHPLLDSLTTWGTSLFWPFEPRLAFSTVFVLDPLYTLTFLVFTIAALWTRNLEKRRRRNLTGVWISSAYLLVGIIVKLSLLPRVDADMEKHGVENYSLRPTPLNILYWNYIGVSQDSVYSGYTGVFTPGLEYEYQTSRNMAFYDSLGLPEDAEYRLDRLTKGLYSLDTLNGEIRISDLRFGLLGLLTEEKDQTPLRSYTWDAGANEFREVRMNPGEAMAGFSWSLYFKRIFGTKD